MPGARGIVSLVARRRFRGNLGAALCPPNVSGVYSRRRAIFNLLQQAVFGFAVESGAPAARFARLPDAQLAQI